MCRSHQHGEDERLQVEIFSLSNIYSRLRNDLNFYEDFPLPIFEDVLRDINHKIFLLNERILKIAVRIFCIRIGI